MSSERPAWWSPAHTTALSGVTACDNPHSLWPPAPHVRPILPHLCASAWAASPGAPSYLFCPFLLSLKAPAEKPSLQASLLRPRFDVTRASQICRVPNCILPPLNLMSLPLAPPNSPCPSIYPDARRHPSVRKNFRLENGKVIFGHSECWRL